MESPTPGATSASSTAAPGATNASENTIENLGFYLIGLGTVTRRPFVGPEATLPPTRPFCLPQPLRQRFQKRCVRPTETARFPAESPRKTRHFAPFLTRVPRASSQIKFSIFPAV